MDNKIKMRVLGLTYSQIQSGAYALILAQIDGPYRIPIVIGASEAQSIAIKLEGIIAPRPMTHDLFESLSHAFGVKLKQVFIYKFEDGIFSSELTFTDGTRQVILDSRTSDAIALALRAQAPIYTTREILEETGFQMESNDNDQYNDPSEETNREPKIENYAIEELEKLLVKYIDAEEYEEAAKIQQIITRKKNQS